MGLTTSRRRRFIESYVFPDVLVRKLADEHDPEGVEMVLEGLRWWYLACLYGGKEVLGMPSRAVDDAWHEMILMTRAYHAFCDKAYGKYLHHTPDGAMSTPMDTALQNTRRVAAKHRLPLTTVNGVAMPLIFAVDAQVGREGPEDAVSAGGTDRRAACGGTGGCSGGGTYGNGGSCSGGGGCGGGGCGGGGGG